MTEKFSALIVDDEPFNIEYLKQELEEYDFEFFLAENGQEAIDLFHSSHPDLILLDMMMPIMDGFAVLEKLKPFINNRETDVIIISALNDISSISRGLRLGAEDYLSKPFDPIILHARVNSIIEKKQLRQIEKKYLAGLEREMEIGREIQSDFLPSQVPQPDGWDIAVRFLPAKNVAGDYYDVFQLSENLLAIISGDVCDKGVGAALYMSLYRSLIHAFTMAEYSKIDSPNNDISLIADQVIGNTLRETNSYICANHEEALFSSLFFGLLDTVTGKMVYVNAGHEPPRILVPAQDQLFLHANSPVIGFDLSSEYLLKSVQINSGSFMLIYSDGVLDAQNNGGQIFRDTAYLDNLHLPIDSSNLALESLLNVLDEFGCGNNQFDDITIIGIKRNGSL